MSNLILKQGISCINKLNQLDREKEIIKGQIFKLYELIGRLGQLQKHLHRLNYQIFNNQKRASKALFLLLCTTKKYTKDIFFIKIVIS